jgi:hypothetical protein
MKYKNYLLLIITFSLSVNVLANDPDIPLIQYSNGSFNLYLPNKMKESLLTYDPNFEPWKTSDYTKKIISDSDPNSKIIAPFALISDVNQDKILDIIIDGHTQSQSEIICILSKGSGYETIKVDSLHSQMDPHEIKNYNEGIVDIGHNYYLWLNEKRSEYPDLIFTIGIPQQSDSKGELLNDGGMIEYFFKNNEFIKSIPEF